MIETRDEFEVSAVEGARWSAQQTARMAPRDIAGRVYLMALDAALASVQSSNAWAWWASRESSERS